MYRIIHLSYQGDGIYQSSPTDYDPMTIDEAWELVTELTKDAIESSSTDRWTIMSQDA